MQKILLILLAAVAAIIVGGGIGYLAVTIMGGRHSQSPNPDPAVRSISTPQLPIPQPVPEVFDNWQVQCIQDAKSHQACRVLHVVADQNGTPQLAVIIRPPMAGASPQGTVVPPWGVLIERGIALRVDTMPALIVSIGSCQQVGCAADFVLNDALQAQLRQGTTLQVSMVAADGTPLAVPVPLTGFDQAYLRLLEKSSP